MSTQVRTSPETSFRFHVMPAKAGTQLAAARAINAYWFPAYAGMTEFTWPFLNREVVSGLVLRV